MKYSLDTYRMYRSESMFSHVIRIVVNMKDTVDPDILRHSVNIAVRRYPYFAVRVTVDKDGAVMSYSRIRSLLLFFLRERKCRKQEANRSTDIFCL